MTETSTSVPKTGRRGYPSPYLGQPAAVAVSISAIILSLILSLYLSDEISLAVKDGLGLAVNVIVPSVFPFIILSDLLYSLQATGTSDLAERGFHRLFGIDGSGLYPFMLGALCGFPMGVRATAKLYRDGCISRDEAERLIGFTNNTGPAFLVCGVGLGMRGRISDGILLYFSMLISAIAVGIIFAPRQKNEKNIHNEKRSADIPRFSLVASIKGAGLSTLNICSFIVFFSAVGGGLHKLLGEGPAYILTLPFLEIGGASAALAKSALISADASLILTGFATGFSGLSVHMQAGSFLIGTDISMKKYYPMKLMQGLISACLCAICILLGFV